MVTVDVPVLGQRDRDQRNGFTIPLRLSPRLVWDVLRCPGWSARLAISGAPRIANFVQPGAPQPAASMIKFINGKMDPSASWAEAEWLRRRWPRKLVIKGVLSPADAARAVDLGFDAIAVSNHGGRQADGSLSAISALPAVVDAVAGRADVYLDGGVRRGTSVAKALALGASAVMMGRPTLYGVAADGEAGANAALSILREEFDRCLALIGCPVAVASIVAISAANWLARRCGKGPDRRARDAMQRASVRLRSSRAPRLPLPVRSRTEAQPAKLRAIGVWDVD